MLNLTSVTVPERVDPCNSGQDAYSSQLHKIRYREVRRYVLRTTGPILDIACGCGYGSAIIDAAERYIGLDIDENAIEYANEHYGAYGLFRKYDGKRIPYDDSSFDIVCSIETIEHLDRRYHNDFYSELCRVLKTDGFLVVSTPNRNYIWKKLKKLLGWRNPYHKYEFKTYEFLNFLSRRASIIDITYMGFPLKLLTNRICRRVLLWNFLKWLSLAEIRLGCLFPSYCDNVLVVLKKRVSKSKKVVCDYDC